MKIKKFNESNEIEGKDVISFMIIDHNNNDDILHSGVFENEKDLNNWILNLVNESISADPDDAVEGTVINNEGEQIFIDVTKAINYYQWYYDQVILIEKTKLYKDIKAKYGVNLIQNTKKYNL